MFEKIREQLIKPGDIKTGQSTLMQMNKILEMIVDAGEALEKKVTKKKAPEKVTVTKKKD
jgi:hypothetical protein